MPGTMYDQYDDKGNPVTVFSNSGLKEQAEFETALKSYNSTGKAPQGYVVLPAGTARAMREGYERVVGGPVQKLAQSIQEQPNVPQVSGLGVMNDVGTAVINWMKNRGVPAAASSVSTPEGMGATAGGLAGAYATGGMSFAPQVIGAAVGTGLGHQALSQLTGGSATLGESALHGFIAAGAQGAIGVVRSILGKSVSDQAAKQVESGIMDSMKRKVGALSADPKAINAYASTKAGIEDIAQQTTKALVGEADKWAGKGISDLQAVLPRNYTVGTQRTVRAQLREITDIGRQMLDVIDDPKAMSALLPQLNAAKQAILDKTKGEFGKMSTYPTVEANVNTFLSAFDTKIASLADGARLLKTLKASGADSGFDVRAFQEQMRSNFMTQGPDSLMAQAGQIAGRGADLRTGQASFPYLKTPGIDTPMEIGLKSAAQRAGVPRMLSAILPNVRYGTSYAGSVKGTYPATTATASQVTRNAITDFLGRKER